MPSTGVKEVDELSDAVTGLNEKVRDNASKVSKIIELVDLPLGIIEYRKKDAKVFCTPKVIGMLGMSQDRFEDGFIEKKYFERYWKRAGLEEALITEIEREYQVNGEIPSRWLNIRSLIDKDRTLVTVMDITKDVYTRQKIEYERDYDILTHLLNRRAFKRRIQEILSGAPASGLGLSAMVMWDLDNLKYVNDTYGHDYGDQYIQKAAGVFAGLSLVGAIVSRMAGDEFLAFSAELRLKEKLMDLLNQVKN
ncbi:MAG: GGDEF domain-containing protein [[Clostridium] scindens]